MNPGAVSVGTEFIASVEGFGIDAVGVCRPEGFTVFVDGALPGEVIRARVFEKKKRYAKARLLEIIEPGLLRAAPFCTIYGECGGCCAQHMTYEAGAEMKRRQVIDAFSHISEYTEAELRELIKPIIKMEQPLRYRNKAEFAVTDSLPLIGYMKKNSHEVISVPDCQLLHQSALQIKRAAGQWLASAAKVPVCKVIARVNKAGEVMAVIDGELSARQAAELVDGLRREVEGLVSVAQLDGKVLYGSAYLTESLLGLTFRISPGAFFQVNHTQAERLFETALDFAALTGNETVIDAYCGTGVLSLASARKSAHVTGIELSRESIADAKQNAVYNNISNVEFIAGAVETELPKLINGKNPDVIMLDPPRKGCAPEVLSAVMEANPARIVYVSCNPSTLARDAQLLRSGGYKLISGVPVDMFGWTGHVETVVLLSHTSQQ